MNGHDHASSCACCTGVTALVPAAVENRAGLSALAWRVGTHPQFVQTMHASISEKDRLRELGRRTPDDFTIALIDAWAVTLDVLAFYQERILNESYLRTAVERGSLLELARQIGTNCVRVSRPARAWRSHSTRRPAHPRGDDSCWHRRAERAGDGGGAADVRDVRRPAGAPTVERAAPAPHASTGVRRLDPCLLRDGDGDEPARRGSGAARDGRWRHRAGAAAGADRASRARARADAHHPHDQPARDARLCS